MRQYWGVLAAALQDKDRAMRPGGNLGGLAPGRSLC
jgi:hypothetical protein